MPDLDYSMLDTPEASARSFHPTRIWSDTPEAAVDYGISVDEDVTLSSRFYAVGRPNPTILFFYGNGEVVATYDEIAPLYNRVGANIFIADYRGYGASSGTPAFTSMLSDAHKVLDWLQDTMESLQFTGPLYVMGRSMGRHAAVELAVNAADRIKGVIIESGRPNLGRFAEGLEPELIRTLEEDYHAKAYAINIPALVIHGQWDQSAPLSDAVDMYNKFATADKHLEIIPGAGHNDLMYVGIRQYFGAIRNFVAAYVGTPDDHRD
jgi:pimeloyl-ACP methyl ester carboxylesterase